MLAYRAANAASIESDTWLTRCRGGERIAAVFFLYVALLAFLLPVPPVKIALACTVPVVIVGAANLQAIHGRRYTAYIRDWLASSLILVAYGEIGWLATGRYWVETQRTWLDWDHALLYRFGLKAGIESLGPAVPAFLEFCYLLLYAIPLVCLLAIYVSKRRAMVDRFYRVFFLGALGAYGTLPLIPIQSPRLFLPDQDLPIYTSVFRKVNIFLLDRLDISTSVFPSGHVAVAFASFWGLYSVLPERRALWGTALCIAVAVFGATIYGRYHYAVDGLASIAITTLAWRVSGLWGTK